MIIFSFEIPSRFENLVAACHRIFDGGKCEFRFFESYDQLTPD